MRAYLRLLRYLTPYRGQLFAAIACMVLYAAMSGASLGVVGPFMRVLFEPSRATQSAPPASPASPVSSASAALGAPPSQPAAVSRVRVATAPAPVAADDRMAGWPKWLRAIAARWLLEAEPRVALGRLCVFLLVVLLLKNLSDYVQSYLMVAVEQAAIRDLRGELFAHLHALPLSFFNSSRTGMLVSRITNDMEYLRASLAAGISNLIKDSLTLIVCLSWVFIAAWNLALVSMLVLPPVALALVAIGRKMRKRSSTAQGRMADVTSILQETIVGARIVKAFGMEAHESRRFGVANDGFFRAFVRLRRVSAAARPVSEYAVVLVAVAMLWYGGQEIFVRHSLAPQQFFVFVTALLSTISPLKSLSEVNTNVQQGIAAAERVFDLLDTPPTIMDAPHAHVVTGLNDGVRYEAIGFAYPGGEPVLREVSFEIKRGQVVALVGSSGAGKSTAMDLLARFHDPTAGRITWDGQDLRGLTGASLRGQMGMVTQETILFHDTVRSNIAYGRPGASEAEIRDAARAAFAHDWIERLPLGYDTIVGERGTRLSGVERQRLSIARALLRNPPLLLLDEATSALDTESERMVQAALELLMKNRTVLVIAHRLSTVQHADAIVVLEHGRVAAVGSHAELLERDGLYRRLHELQFAV